MGKPWVVGIILIILFAGIGVVGLTSQSIFTLGDIYNTPSLPTEGRLLRPLYGTMFCDETGNKVSIETGGFEKCTEAGCGYKYDPGFFDNKLAQYVYYKWIECPLQSEYESKPCEVEIYPVSICGSGYTTFYRTDLDFFVKENWKVLTSNTRVPIQSRGVIAVMCTESTNFLSSRKDPILRPLYNLRFWERGIYIEGSDLLEQGLLLGSTPYCSWVSATERSDILAIQMKGGITDTQIKSSMDLGRSQSIIAGYDDYPLYGNVNPLGVQFKGRDVVCTAGVNPTLHYAEKFETVNNKDYYKLGSIVSNAPTSTCCGPNQCSVNFYCEDYECKPNPVCPGDQCGPFYVERSYCEYRGGNYYQVTTECDMSGCVKENLNSVKCCAGSCPAGYTCYLDAGCIKDDIPKKTCPSGMCCAATDSVYNAGGCPEPLECCWNDNADKDLGACKDTCQYPIEKCENNIDDDGDGLIDEKDPDCANACLVKCEEMSDWNPNKYLCKLGCSLESFLAKVLQGLVFFGILIGSGILVFLIVLIVKEVKKK